MTSLKSTLSTICLFPNLLMLIDKLVFFRSQKCPRVNNGNAGDRAIGTDCKFLVGEMDPLDEIRRDFQIWDMQIPAPNQQNIGTENVMKSILQPSFKIKGHKSQ